MFSWLMWVPVQLIACKDDTIFCVLYVACSVIWFPSTSQCVSSQTLYPPITYLFACKDSCLKWPCYNVLSGMFTSVNSLSARCVAGLEKNLVFWKKFLGFLGFRFFRFQCTKTRHKIMTQKISYMIHAFPALSFIAMCRILKVFVKKKLKTYSLDFWGFKGFFYLKN